MTPALKAMVEAMAAELQRQNEAELQRQDGGVESDEGGPVVVSELHDGVSCYVDGDINLEKVARAAFSVVAEAAFRDGFSAGEDYMTDAEKDRRADAAWEFYRASLPAAFD